MHSIFFCSISFFVNILFLSFGFRFGQKELWHLAKLHVHCALDRLDFVVPGCSSHVSFSLQLSKETFSCSVSVLTGKKMSSASLSLVWKKSFWHCNMQRKILCSSLKHSLIEAVFKIR